MFTIARKHAGTAFAAMLLAGATSPASAAITLLTDNFNGAAQALGVTSVTSAATWLTSATGPNPSAGGGVDVIGSGGSYDFYPGNGNYVDLDGTSPNQGPTFLYADVSTLGLPGAPSYTFTMTFDAGLNPNSSGSKDIVVFMAGGAPGAAINQGQTNSFVQYSREISGTWTPGVPIRVGFYTSSADGQGPIIDNIQLSVTPVPEPHEWAMMLAGLGLVGWVAARRTRGGVPGLV